MQKFKTLDEINQLVRLLQSEPEIKNKVEHYNSVIKSSDKLVKAIEEKLSNTTDRYESAKLELEKIDAEQKVFNATQYYQIWSHRAVDFDIRYKEVVADCDANYDTIIAEGEVVREKNAVLNMLMGEHAKLENVSDKLRVEYYLMVRQAVENHKKHYGIKGSLI